MMLQCQMSSLVTSAARGLAMGVCSCRQSVLQVSYLYILCQRYLKTRLVSQDVVSHVRIEHHYTGLRLDRKFRPALNGNAYCSSTRIRRQLGRFRQHDNAMTASSEGRVVLAIVRPSTRSV
ncbi:hypothetical protein F5B19DRAFT_272364 [Rostrohypoxylon terebratum]|nr:hypothetical protein F5B19DRAFT_272364 [Rostrohypoxylon terebratum]